MINPCVRSWTGQGALVSECSMLYKTSDHGRQRLIADFMAMARAKAEQAALQGEVPVGAILVQQGQIISCAANQVEADHDPTAHAEILVIRAAARLLQRTRLEECDLYVTLEPCPMCAAAIAHARLRRVYFGAYDPKGGGIEHGARVFHRTTCHHRPEIIGGVQEQQCALLLRQFFQSRR